MPKSCKCILDKMVFKGAMTEAERDKILRNIKTKWIPVTERLPEKLGDYIATVDYGKYGKAVGMRNFTGGLWNDDCVVAWMPFPEPYEGSDTK